MSDDRLDSGSAQRLARAAQAAQQLSDLLWEALREELADPRHERVAELSERLVAVAGTVGSLARSDDAASERQRFAAQPGVARPDLQHAPARGPARERPASATVLVDELAAQGDTAAYAAARARRRPPTAIEDLL